MNPRKFSEKIALHTQKQAEETAAFEQIMKEVGRATKKETISPVHPTLAEYKHLSGNFYSNLTTSDQVTNFASFSPPNTFVTSYSNYTHNHYLSPLSAAVNFSNTSINPSNLYGGSLPNFYSDTNISTENKEDLAFLQHYSINQIRPHEQCNYKEEQDFRNLGSVKPTTFDLIPTQTISRNGINSPRRISLTTPTISQHTNFIYVNASAYSSAQHLPCLALPVPVPAGITSTKSTGQATAINLQDALQTLDSIKDRKSGRSPIRTSAAHHFPRSYPNSKTSAKTRARSSHNSAISPVRSILSGDRRIRMDLSPYGSPYLSPPSPESSWRRTNSDSALNASSPPDTSLSFNIKTTTGNHPAISIPYSNNLYHNRYDIEDVEYCPLTQQGTILHSSQEKSRLPLHPLNGITQRPFNYAFKRKKSNSECILPTYDESRIVQSNKLSGPVSYYINKKSISSKSPPSPLVKDMSKSFLSAIHSSPTPISCQNRIPASSESPYQNILSPAPHKCRQNDHEGYSFKIPKLNVTSSSSTSDLYKLCLCMNNIKHQQPGMESAKRDDNINNGFYGMDEDESKTALFLSPNEAVLGNCFDSRGNLISDGNSFGQIRTTAASSDNNSGSLPDLSTLHFNTYHHPTSQHQVLINSNEYILPISNHSALQTSMNLPNITFTNSMNYTGCFIDQLEFVNSLNTPNILKKQNYNNHDHYNASERRETSPNHKQLKTLNSMIFDENQQMNLDSKQRFIPIPSKDNTPASSYNSSLEDALYIKEDNDNQESDPRQIYANNKGFPYLENRSSHYGIPGKNILKDTLQTLSSSYDSRIDETSVYLSRFAENGTGDSGFYNEPLAIRKAKSHENNLDHEELAPLPTTPQSTFPWFSQLSSSSPQNLPPPENTSVKSRQILESFHRATNGSCDVRVDHQQQLSGLPDFGYLDDCSNNSLTPHLCTGYGNDIHFVTDSTAKTSFEENWFSNSPTNEPSNSPWQPSQGALIQTQPKLTFGGTAALKCMGNNHFSPHWTLSQASGSEDNLSAYLTPLGGSFSTLNSAPNYDFKPVTPSEFRDVLELFPSDPLLDYNEAGGGLLQDLLSSKIPDSGTAADTNGSHFLFESINPNINGLISPSRKLGIQPSAKSRNIKFSPNDIPHIILTEVEDKSMDALDMFDQP